MLHTRNSAKYTAITCSPGTYKTSSLETLLKIHSLRDISLRVNQEVHAKKQKLAEMFTYQVLSIAPPLPSPLIYIVIINEDNVTIGYYATFAPVLYSELQ